MRNRWLLLAGIAIASVAGGSMLLAQHAPIAKADAHFSAGAAPIAFDLFRGDRIFFKGTVNGRPAEIMLDSGAGVTVVNSDFAAAAGLKGGSSITVRGIGGDSQGQLAQGVTLAAGPLTLTGATVLLLDINQVSTGIGRRIDMVLGRDAFDSGIVDIDFEKHTLRFLPTAGFAAPKGSTRLPLTSDAHGIRQMPVTIGDAAPMPAEFDLGHGGSLILSKPAWENSPDIAALPFGRVQSGGVGGMSDKRLVTLPTVTVAGQRFVGVPATLNQDAVSIPTSGGNVGIDILQRFHLQIDFGGNALYLTPIAGAAAPLPKDRLGMRLELSGDRLKVPYVSPEGPAAAAGWKAGDSVVSINGVRVTPAFYQTGYASMTRLAAGTRLDLVRADGAHLPVVLKDFF